MRDAELPSDARDCSSFEFSRIRQMAAGHLREDWSNNYLAAWAGDEIYVYLIRGISSEGILDKKVWVLKVPTGFKNFMPGQVLVYKTTMGTARLNLAN
jgi:hypothetical protein